MQVVEDVAMTNLNPAATLVRTLADRLSEGKMFMPEALPCALAIAESIHELHARGRTHGAVSPANIVITDTGLTLGPPVTTRRGSSAGYSADVFSFGAVLYQMLSGCKAFSEEDLAEAPDLPRCGETVLFEPLIMGCLASDPKRRFQSMKKVLVELKLLHMRVRRTTPVAQPRPSATDTALPAGIQQFEAGVAARLEEHEKETTASLQAAADGLKSLAAELAALRAELHSVRERATVHAAVVGGIDSVLQQVAVLENRVSAGLQDYDKKLEEQSAAVSSVRNALAGTDSLVERLVETIELIQTVVVDEHDSL
jgi:hypothetical protein